MLSVIILLSLVLYDISISIFLFVVGVSIEMVSSCMLIFCFASMVLIIYKQDRSAAILAKQLRFKHRNLTLNTHDKSVVVMMAVVIGLFLL